MLTVSAAVDRVGTRAAGRLAVLDGDRVDVSARVVAVTVVADVHVPAAVAVENGHGKPLPPRALFVDRFAGFLTVGFVLRHGFSHRDNPARVFHHPGVPSIETPRGADLSLPLATQPTVLSLAMGCVARRK